MDSKPLLVVITGPTAVGKTAVSIALAKALDTVILSADSRQFYAELNIGTAKPDAAQFSEVQHYFVGQLSIHDYYNVARYEADVLQLLPSLFEKHPVVLMVGGSGLYIDAVCRGIDDFPDPTPELRNYLKGILADEGISKLQDLLQQHDPAHMLEVDIANPKRLLRALEVCMTTGKPYSEQRMNQSKARDFRVVKIGLNLPRAELFARIGQRVDQMMVAGLLEETKQFIPLRHLNALNTVGYKELFTYLDGEVSLERAVENIKTNTRRYAKRQLTWFKRDMEMKWFEPHQTAEILDLCIQDY
ncbi:MAG TPA: tRNA (adenosine(37)-N6)-dimethylallyltransferase MiaA [Bacteroidales bacterium]